MNHWHNKVIKEESDKIKRAEDNVTVCKELRSLCDKIMVEHYLLRKSIDKKSAFKFLSDVDLLNLLTNDDRFTSRFKIVDNHTTYTRTTYTRICHLETNYSFIYNVFYSSYQENYVRESRFIKRVMIIFLIFAASVISISCLVL